MEIVSLAAALAAVSSSIGKIESRDDDDSGNPEKISMSFTMPNLPRDS